MRPQGMQKLLDALSTFQISNERIGISVPAGKYSAAEGTDVGIDAIEIKRQRNAVAVCAADHGASPLPFANLPRTLMSTVVPFPRPIIFSIAGPAVEQTAHSTGSGVLVALETLTLSMVQSILISSLLPVSSTVNLPSDPRSIETFEQSLFIAASFLDKKDIGRPDAVFARGLVVGKKHIQALGLDRTATVLGDIARRAAIGIDHFDGCAVGNNGRIDCNGTSLSGHSAGGGNTVILAATG
nr:MAG TPA: PGAP1-like protein [Caudoviricetes sp.]